MLLRFIITFATLFLGNMIVPQYIVSDSWKTTLLATVCLTIAQVIIGIIATLFIVLSSLIFGFSETFTSSKKFIILYIVAIILAIVLCMPISLYVTTLIIDNFQINGIMTYIILTIIIGLLSIRNTSEKSNTETT